MDNFIQVTVGKLPGKMETVGVQSGATVQDALSAAGLDASGLEIRVGSSVATPTTALKSGDMVCLVKKIKGNRQ